MRDPGLATDSEILVTSHVDAFGIAEGVLDNGAGAATAVEIATALELEVLTEGLNTIRDGRMDPTTRFR